MFGNRRARPGAALATAAASSWGAGAACAGAAVVSVPAACAAVEEEAPASDDALGVVIPPLESSDVGVCWIELVLVDGMAGDGRKPGVVVTG